MFYRFHFSNITITRFLEFQYWSRYQILPTMLGTIKWYLLPWGNISSNMVKWLCWANVEIKASIYNREYCNFTIQSKNLKIIPKIEIILQETKKKQKSIARVPFPKEIQENEKIEDVAHELMQIQDLDTKGDQVFPKIKNKNNIDLRITSKWKKKKQKLFAPTVKASQLIKQSWPPRQILREIIHYTIYNNYFIN